jgi:hypothetical protein
MESGTRCCFASAAQEGSHDAPADVRPCPPSSGLGGPCLNWPCVDRSAARDPFSTGALPARGGGTLHNLCKIS